MPLIISNQTLFPYIVGKAIYARSMIEVTFGIWLLLIFFYPRYRPSRSLIVAALGVWLLISLIAGLAGVSAVRSLWSTYERMQGIVDLAHWFAFIAMTGSVFRSLSDWRILFTVNLIVCMIVSFLGINQHYGMFDISSFGVRPTDRIESTLGNATYVGAYTMVNALIALSLIFHSFGKQIANVGGEQQAERAVSQSRTARRRRSRARQPAPTGVSFDYLPWLMSVWVLSFMLNLWALWLTGTRGAVIGLGSAALIFSIGYIIWGRIRVAKIISYALVAAAIVVIGLFAAVRTSDILDPIVESNTMLSRISSIGWGDASISGRLAGAHAGLLAYAEKPALGWGPENFLIAWGKYIGTEAAERDRFDQAHNKLVEELTTKGTLGLVSYMLVWAAMVWAMFKSIRRRQGYQQIAVLIMAAAMLAYFVQNLFLFDTPVTIMQFSLLAAFAIAQEYWTDDRDDKKSQSWTAGGLGGKFSLRPVYTALRTSWGAVAVMAVMSVAVIAALYALNLRAYNAAADIATFNISSGSETTWEERVAYAEESIIGFPGLANYSRRYVIKDGIARLSQLSDEEFLDAVSLIEKIGDDALAVEPNNWRIIAVMIHFHQTASERDRAYLEDAEEGLKKIMEIAPNLPDTQILAEVQNSMEGAAGATP